MIQLKSDDLPAQIDADGGWINKSIIPAHLNFCRAMFEAFGDLVSHWILFIEINHSQELEKSGWGTQEYYQVIHHQFLANASACMTAHEMISEVQIGCEIACGNDFIPMLTPEDQWLTDQRKRELFFFSDVMMRGAYPPYMEHLFALDGIQIQKTDMDAIILQRGVSDFVSIVFVQGNEGRDADEQPISLRIITNNISDRYRSPVMITLAQSDDIKMYKAISDMDVYDGIAVIGVVSGDG